MLHGKKIKYNLDNNMFCCTQKESHQGEIVTAVCLEQPCVKVKNQLACALCLEQNHKGHMTTSMRKIVPDLLEAHSDKIASESKLNRLFEFVVKQFGNEFISGEETTKNNLIERVEELLTSLKREVQTTGEEISKMKNIFKTLNKATTNHVLPKHSPSKLGTDYAEDMRIHTSSSAFSGYKGHGNPVKNKGVSQLPLTSSQKVQMDTFSISAKHPYLHLSPDLRTVTKTSHSGHRFAVIGAQVFTPDQNEVTISIDKSISGNIMVGVCHENMVKDKEYANCYGIKSGTYLVGQNGNNPTTAISFHNSLAVFNRKEIVGWNFETSDFVVISINFEEDLVCFQRRGKKGAAQFTMKLKAESQSQGSSFGLKLVVLLQSQGDQVSILENQ